MYLNEYLLKSSKDKNIQIIINNLSSAAIEISNKIRNIVDDSDKEKVNTKNVDGDTQKPLDILSDEILIDFLKKSPVSAYASEEQEGFVDFKNENEFIVFADPLDGSSNIDVNVSIGTIFSIMSST
jgi:fructose-1,6-bisphosphatase I